MHAQEFERKFFELVFRTNIKLTPYLISYRLGLPFKEVKHHLEQMAHEGIISMEVDDGGVISFEVPGAERPARDWLSPTPTPAMPLKTEPMGQWFSGPALEEPPNPLQLSEETPVFVSSPPRAWLWVPLLLIFGLLLLPFLFGLLFYCVSDSSGFGLFFLLSIFLLKASCGASACGQSYKKYEPHCTRRVRRHL
jgi:hypothetical protein